MSVNGIGKYNIVMEDQTTNKKGMVMAKKEETEQKEGTESVEVQVARNLNEACKLEPQIDLALPVENLREFILLAADNCVREGDDLSEETVDFIKKLKTPTEQKKKEAKKEVKKPNKPKKDVKKEDDKTKKNLGKVRIADVIRQGIKDGLDNEKILMNVKKKFPDCNTNAGCVTWYRCHMKKK
jgi:hypothetical protein